MTEAATDPKSRLLRLLPRAKTLDGFGDASPAEQVRLLLAEAGFPMLAPVAETRELVGGLANTGWRQILRAEGIRPRAGDVWFGKDGATVGLVAKIRLDDAERLSVLAPDGSQPWRTLAGSGEDVEIAGWFRAG